MCPAMWCTPMSGNPADSANALAATTPTRSEPTSPGPWVTATADRSPSPIPARSSASSTMRVIVSTCLRDATSGTTPPNRSWMSIWLETTFDSTSVPSRTTAAAVSSQLVSMARMQPFFTRASSFLSVRSCCRRHAASRQIRPHDQRVFSVVGVIAAPDAFHAESEFFVKPLRRHVGYADFQGHPLHAPAGRESDQFREQPLAELPAAVRPPEPDVGHVGFVHDRPQPAVADDVALPQHHEIMGELVVHQLVVEGIPRRLHGQACLFNVDDRVDVLQSHPAEADRLRRRQVRGRKAPSGRPLVRQPLIRQAVFRLPCIRPAPARKMIVRQTSSRQSPV